jgi:eukaryotic-like serine/threonine-protein kinase
MQQPQALWLVANRYFVGSVVGRGGYGMVCRGVDRKTGQPVALKMLSPDAGRDSDAVERMLREQQALVALSGTCAVAAVDLCRLESGAPCLVMEWLEGQDLEHQLSAWEASGQRGNREQLLTLLAPIAETLDRAHGIGIVHRDIKPANIFLSTAGPGARLLDFGLARMKSSAPLTAEGMVMGSPSYIAPESWRGNSAEVDGRADLFSLGVIVFRWLTGKLPFDAPDLVGKMLAVTSGPRPSAVALDPQLPPALDTWVARALAIAPDERFQSGQELYEALAAALNLAAPPRSKPPLSPRALGDAQEALAAAFRSAAGLLKRFTQPAPPDPDPGASGSPPPAHSAGQPQQALPDAPPAPTPAASTANTNTVWLDSSELVPAAGNRNTVWLDSSELVPATGTRNTVWLDSNELVEVAPQPAAPPASSPSPANPAVPDESASSGSDAASPSLPTSAPPPKR